MCHLKEVNATKHGQIFVLLRKNKQIIDLKKEMLWNNHTEKLGSKSVDIAKLEKFTKKINNIFKSFPMVYRHFVDDLKSYKQKLIKNSK